MNSNMYKRSTHSLEFSRDSLNCQIKNLIAQWESSLLEPFIFGKQIVDNTRMKRKSSSMVEAIMDWWRPFNMITKCWSFQSTKFKFIKSEQTYQVFQFLRCWNKFYPKKHGSSNYWVDKNHGHIMYAKENSHLTNPLAINWYFIDDV